ncbi:hypothetical protein UFOVP816_56 [uncultured Caudovirales phage]|uniref:Uncharacterized protein n=1 Tax=uncultured Caudovirales phage TaxID=2100421 RepID=A0A6J5P5U4_9CAUD|nr:hypothetical protein UFOVP816_56 [uncultured Caudovirales phage]
MNLLSDIITYMRRIIKTPNGDQISDNLLIDYINRFWLMDVQAEMQLFDFKTKYQFQTTPGISQYNMPMYDVQVQPGGQNIAPFPVYQGFMAPAKVNGIDVPFYTQRGQYFDLWPNYSNSLAPTILGNGTAGPYTINLSYSPVVPGHVDIAGIIATGVNNDPIYDSDLNLLVPVTSTYSSVYITATGADGRNIVVADSGQFLANTTDGDIYGLLMTPGNAPNGNIPLPNGGSLPTRYATNQNTINYNTGTITNLYFPVSIPDGANINTQCFWFNPGLPRAILFENNIITIRNPPDKQYLIELDAYLTPAAFLSTSQAIPFAYMCEYIARGAARKVLSDTMDTEQFAFYEKFYIEQRELVWKRSQRQNTATRTQTLYSQSGFGNANSNGLYGTGAI